MYLCGAHQCRGRYFEIAQWNISAIPLHFSDPVLLTRVYTGHDFDIPSGENGVGLGLFTINLLICVPNVTWLCGNTYTSS